MSMTPLQELKKKLEAEMRLPKYTSNHRNAFGFAIAEIDLLLEKEKEYYKQTIIETYDKSFMDQMDGVLMSGEEYYRMRYQ